MEKDLMLGMILLVLISTFEGYRFSPSQLHYVEILLHIEVSTWGGGSITFEGTSMCRGPYG